MTQYYYTAWQSWTSGTATTVTDSCTASNSATWIQWNELGSAAFNVLPTQGHFGPYQPVQVVMGTEQISTVNLQGISAPNHLPIPDIEAVGRRLQEEAEETRKRQVEAVACAEDLLQSIIEPEQWQEWKKRQTITIVAKDTGKKKWVLTNESSYNVKEYNESGKRIKEHCVVTPNVPMPDQLATQYLYLHSNPELLLRAANTRPL